MSYIMIVARGCPNERYPGNGIFEFDQAKALAKAGCKVVYAAVDLRSIRRWRKLGIDRFVKDGVSVYIINIPLGRVPHAVLSFCGKLGLGKLFSIIKREQGGPDIIHAHFLEIAEIALSLKGKTAAKFVMTEHTGLLSVPKWAAQDATYIYASYNKVIAVSSNQKFLDGFKAETHTNCVVIPNMLDPLFLKKDVQLPSAHSFSFVFVGSLDVNKSPIECILAFKEAFCERNFAVKESQKIIRLKIIGDGPLLSACKSLVQRLEISQHVQFMGRILRDEVAKELSIASCFVLPSKLETFGVAYIEAMACGLPVIATKCGGPESFVDDTNGLLIPIEDKAALIEAFQYMVRNIRKENIR